MYHPVRARLGASSDKLTQGMKQPPGAFVFPFTSSLKRCPEIQVGKEPFQRIPTLLVQS